MSKVIMQIEDILDFLRYLLASPAGVAADKDSLEDSLSTSSGSKSERWETFEIMFVMSSTTTSR
jgi:hypothetical protein